MRKTYNGPFRPTKPRKYKGNTTNITYRSNWELQVMKYCDTNDSIVKWSSEEVIVPYVSPMDKRYHRYYVDFWIKKDTGEELLVEVKPKKETRVPKKPKRQTKKFINEATTYMVNDAKWNAAKEYASTRKMKFEIWTEDTLRSMGLLPKPPKKTFKKMSPYKRKPKN